jgi:thiol-disulfide isomerase/thioredoxin
LTKKISPQQAKERLSQRTDLNGFEDAFKMLEERKAELMFYSLLSPVSPDSLYYTKHFREESRLFEMEEYRSFMGGAIYKLSGAKTTSYDNYQDVKRRLDFVMLRFKNPQIRSFWVDQYVMAYIRSKGIDQAEPLLALHRKTVIDPEAQQAFEQQVQLWSTVKKGTKMPNFSYMDIAGKQVSLQDLQGKYIYIDFWATWCGPCKEEIPALEKLQQAMAGGNIVFLSISFDKDMEKWRQMVLADKMQGLQLHAGPDNELKKVLMISSIPRFVLLDTKGALLDANMSRPSNSQTLTTLKALSGI